MNTLYKPIIHISKKQIMNRLARYQIHDYEFDEAEMDRLLFYQIQITTSTLKALISSLTMTIATVAYLYTLCDMIY